MWQRLILVGCCLALSWAAAGCGSAVKGADPNLVAVTGKVTIDGKPVKTGDIGFVSSDGSGKGSGGVIDASGNYSLMQSTSAKGVLPGDYLVRIVALDGSPTMGEKGQVNKPKSQIPEKYNDAKTSGLTAKVEKGSSKTINFDLKSQ